MQSLLFLGSHVMRHNGLWLHHHSGYCYPARFFEPVLSFFAMWCGTFSSLR